MSTKVAGVWEGASWALAKNLDPSKIPLCGEGPGFFYPQRGFALLKVH